MTIDALALLIKAARETRKLSQEALSDQIKLNRRSISEFERGYRTELGLGRFLSLCDALGLEMQLLPKDRELADALETLQANGRKPAILDKFEQRKRMRDIELGIIQAQDAKRH